MHANAQLKIGRALDLCFQALMPRSEGKLNIRISSSALDIDATLKAGFGPATLDIPSERTLPLSV